MWIDQASLDKFATNDPSRRIIDRLRPLMGPTRFATRAAAQSRITPATDFAHAWPSAPDKLRLIATILT